MDFITFVLRLGLDPDCFENRLSGPEASGDGFVYRLYQRDDVRECPHCHSKDAVVRDRHLARVNCSTCGGIRDVALILKVRFTCKSCGRTFTPPIRGVSRYATVSDVTKAQIRGEFLTNQTFSSIARRYGVDESYAVRLFDADYPTVPGLRLPEVMCIDEIRFNRRDDERFPCVVYDWRRREVVDLATSRRREFLDEFFSSKRQEELDGVRYFVSDMYDAYAAVKRVYFPKAIHIVDFFHVAALLTNAVGKLRVNAMNTLEKGSPEYAFMKSKWRLFLCRRSKVPDKAITRRNGEVEHYDDLLFRCVRSTRNLWDGYDILQELLSYREYGTFTEAIAFVERISKRLQDCPSELLKTVGRSYWHWRVEIASGLARNQSGEHFSNGVAEGLNNQIKTIKKLANGYDNFGRFRKRVLLALTYSKKP